MNGNELELDEGDVFDTNTGGGDGLPLGVVVPTPPTAPGGGAVALAPLTALLGAPGGAVGAVLGVAPGVLGEHLDGVGGPAHFPGGGMQLVAVGVLVHGGGMQLVVGVLVHGGGVQLVVGVLVHGGGVQLVVGVLVHGGGGLQPVCAGLVLPMPWLRSHS